MITLKWTAPSGTEITFSRASTDYRLLKAYNGFTITPVTHRTVKAPYQHGSTYLDSVVEPREMTFDIMIVAADLEELQGKIQALAAAMNPVPGEGTLSYTKEDGTVYVCYCIANNNPVISTNVRGNTFQQATISLIAHDPFWYSGSSHVSYLSNSPTAWIPWVMPWVIGSYGSTTAVTNSGSQEAPVTIHILGPVTNPIIYNLTSDQSLNLTLTLAATETIDINTSDEVLSATITHDDGTTENAYPYLTLPSEMWKLQPGINAVQFGGSAGSSDTVCSITWTDVYVGV